MQETLSDRIINDPIYGRVKLPRLCFDIMDTMHFQRLRFIKCLGMADFVYPSGVHSRFTHSVGGKHGKSPVKDFSVAWVNLNVYLSFQRTTVGSNSWQEIAVSLTTNTYLAGKCVKRLKKKQSDLGITAQDVLAVQIAGLCHDLGHAPFSHVFESNFLPAITSERKRWEHEANSVAVFLHMLQSEPSLYESMLRVLDSNDITFICEAINPDPTAATGDWCYRGRSKEKAFLYEIIANKNTGIDVDRFDYIRRDAYYIGIHVNFDLNRLLDNMTVTEFDGQRRIIYLEKVKLDVQALYYTRKELHARVYQHKTVKLLDAMLVEALLLADPFIEIPFRDSTRTATLSESVLSVSSFLSTTDRIFDSILYATKLELQPARAALHRIVTRKLFQTVCSMKLSSEEVANLSERSGAGEGHACMFKRLIIGCVRPEDEISAESLSQDMVLTVTKMYFGEEMDENGIVRVPFYNPKTRKLVIEQIQVLPPDKSAVVIRVYSKSNEASCRERIISSCRKWCRRFNLSQDIEVYG